jgi:hypothetical protein
MVTLRATRKVLKYLPNETDSGRPPDTGLGDWYVNRLVIDRKPLLLLVSSLSLLAIVKPARNVKMLPHHLPDMVAGRLHRLGVAPDLINAEVDAMEPVGVGKTADRSVVGIMVDFAKMIPFHFPPGGWDETWLSMAEERLQENPCHAGRSFENVIFPDSKAVELLKARWKSV